MLHFRYASRTSQGGRPYQEDASAVWDGRLPVAPLAPQPVTPQPGSDGVLLAVLADGMGGHAGGAVASRTICDTFIASFRKAAGGVAQRLDASLGTSNDAIRDAVAANATLHGMGATLVGTFLTAAGAEWVSVGDSPMFLLRGGELARLNEDHSLAPVIDRLVVEGKMDAEAARNDPRRHYLRAAITGDDLDLVDRSERPLVLEAGDLVIIASDGLHTLDEEEIKRIANGYVVDGPDSVAAALLRAVAHAGDPHQDNTTLVVVAVEPA